MLRLFHTMHSLGDEQVPVIRRILVTVVRKLSTNVTNTKIIQYIDLQIS
jgi:hypothetical protein